MNEFNQKDNIYKDSPYKFIELSDGFRVTGTDRLPVEVRLVNKGKALLIESDGIESKHFGLFQYHELVKTIAINVLTNWSPRGEIDIPKWLERWAKTNTAKSINKRTHDQWGRLLNLADPTALTVQKAIFAVSRNCSSLALEDELYSDHWLVNDIIRYRAAAISTCWFNTLIHNNVFKKVIQIDNGIIGAELTGQINEYGARYIDPDEDVLDGENYWDGIMTPSSISNETGVKYLRDWQALYSYDGKPYRSLDRTLMNLPGGIPMHLLWRLGFIKLPRPITNRLELSLVLGYLRYEVHNPNWHVIHHARSDQSKTALRNLSDYARIDLNYRKWWCIQHLAMYLHEYPYRHAGNVVGLIDKSIDWHRGFTNQRSQQEIQKYDNSDTATPPMALPEIPGITFLANVSAICQEGARMQHCISKYLRQAVEGRCYLFHIEKDGEEASAMVTYNGDVPQSYGPRDCLNKASVWGARVLRKWSEPLKDVQPISITAPVFGDIPF